MALLCEHVSKRKAWFWGSAIVTTSVFRNDYGLALQCSDHSEKLSHRNIVFRKLKTRKKLASADIGRVTRLYVYRQNIERLQFILENGGAFREQNTIVKVKKEKRLVIIDRADDFYLSTAEFKEVLDLSPLIFSGQVVEGQIL
ncbi:MAG: hypothetical protein AAGA12_00650 [Pseudomonadota bacterium]